MSLLLDGCTFKPPSLHAWTYVLVVFVVCIVGATISGILLYLVSSSPRFRKPLSVIVGILYAASVPLVGRPYLEEYYPRDGSIAFMGLFVSSAFGFATFFRATNAGFGNFPEGADRDLQTWVLWVIATPEVEFTKGKLSKASTKEILTKIQLLFYKIFCMSIIVTIMLQHSSTGYKLQLSQLPEWCSTHINGLIHIWMLYLFAAFCMDFSTLANTLTMGGMRYEPGFLNPLLKSRCLKEAWGSRWNLPVHVLLKRTVYVPARKQGIPKGVAAFLTFLASGLIHEYTFSIHNYASYVPYEAVTFFVLNGLLMLGESWIWRHSPLLIRTIIDALPSVVTATGIAFSLAGPFERYFIHGWLEAGFVEALAQLFPHLSC